MKQILALAILLSCYSGYAQNTKVQIVAPDKLVKNSRAKATPLEVRFIGFRNPPSVNLEWQPFLNTIISQNESENDEALERIKEEKDHLKQTSPQSEAKNTAITPVVSTNFAGVSNGGTNTPLDNTVAISNGGYIVAFVNSKVGYYSQTGSLLYTQSLVGLINDPNLSTNLCDPKVIYDNGADRFIMYVQTCDAQSATSAIVVGFSKTNNPSNGWYFYNYTGNPLNDGSWFDYPKIAVSTDELFVTGNLFSEGNNQFNQSIVYQIQKTPCLTGATPQTQFWHDIAPNAFTILPVSAGQGNNYGPGIYLVSTAGATQGDNNINLYDITNNISSGTAALNVYTVGTSTYSTPGQSSQLGGTKPLNTGDCRSLDGFYLNGIIHFVFNTDAGNGWSGINYNRLTVSSATNISSTIGQAGVYDYCYPAVASASNVATDKSVIIAYNKSGPSIYPATMVIGCDNLMSWSSPVLVKAGASYIDYTWNTNNSERWGDYTGIARKQNDNPATVWMAGMYGNSQQTWSQWIAKIKPGADTITAVANNNPEQHDAMVYPNPIVAAYNVIFEMTEKAPVTISITDMEGRMVKELYSGTAEHGKNMFTFNKANLSAGVYFLNIYNSQKIIKNERIVISQK